MNDESYVEYRKAEPRFNVLSNPNGSVAANRITRLEVGLEERDAEIAKLRKEVEEIKLMRDDIRRASDLKFAYELAPNDEALRNEILKRLQSVGHNA